jgi:hypothetical protein
MSDERPGGEPRREPWRERFDDLKGAYALGALDESEREEFEGYLVAHPELQAEVDELGSVADLLALAPQEYEPSPELRRTLLDRIGDVSNATPQRRARSRGRIFGRGGLATAAAVLAVVGLFLWNASLRGEVEDLRGTLETRETHELQGSGRRRTSGERSSRSGTAGPFWWRKTYPPLRRAKSTKPGSCMATFRSPPGSSNRATEETPQPPSRAPSTRPTPWL